MDGLDDTHLTNEDIRVMYDDRDEEKLLKLGRERLGASELREGVK